MVIMRKSKEDLNSFLLCLLCLVCQLVPYYKVADNELKQTYWWKLKSYGIQSLKELTYNI